MTPIHMALVIGVLLTVFSVVGYVVVVSAQHRERADGYSDLKSSVFAVAVDHVAWVVVAQMGAVAVGLGLRTVLGV